MTSASALAWATAKLKNHSDSADLDSAVVLGSILKKTSAQLLANPNQPLNFWQFHCFKQKIKRRAAGEPIAYLINKKEFYKLDFYVDKRVLIPRPATETVIGYAHQIINRAPADCLVCDIGTGSGCIAIILAKYFPQTDFIASDISLAALRVAKINARRHQTNNIKFLRGGLWRPIEKYLQNHRRQANKELIVIANLPYLTAGQITTHLKHEPRLALHGGIEGLEVYKNLFKQIVLSNITPSHLFIEINPEQKMLTENMQQDLLKIYQRISLNDLSGQLRYYHFYQK